MDLNPNSILVFETLSTQHLVKIYAIVADTLRHKWSLQHPQRLEAEKALRNIECQLKARNPEQFKAWKEACDPRKHFS